MATLDPNKAWAEGMKQPEFEIDFLRRNPTADSIPNLNEWLGRSAEQYHGIDPFNPEELILDDVTAHENDKKPKEAEKKVYNCKGCKQEFEYPIARYQHEKKCAVLLVEASL